MQWDWDFPSRSPFLLYMLMVGPSLHPVGNSLVVGSSVQVWTCGVNISARYIGYSWLYNHFVPLLGINWSVNVEFLPRFNVIWSFFPTFLVLVLLFWREVAFLCCCYTAELDVYSCTGQSPVACLCCLLSVWIENAKLYCCYGEDTGMLLFVGALVSVGLTMVI